MRTLRRAEWGARAREHLARVGGWTQARVARRRRGERHPVEDFLFEYYNLSPTALERWHPGLDVALEEADEYRSLGGYRSLDDGRVIVDESRLPKRLPGLRWTRELLSRTARRPAQLGCFGLHEWAMVYREAEERRHPVPLRLGTAGTDAVVESHRLKCTHADAFRFYTDAARPLNTPTPTRERQLGLEQPGCLHANMDLYRIAFRMLPFIDSGLVADTFDLAMAIRQTDMMASPYDLSDYGYPAIRVETAEGKAEYVRRQREFMTRAEPLRARLLDSADTLIQRAESRDARGVRQ